MADSPKADHSCGLGCLAVIVICGIIAGISTLVTSWQGAAPQERSESSAEKYCEKEIERGVKHVLDQRGRIQYKHLGVGSYQNEYKVTSVINVEGIASGNRQSRWVCRIEWDETTKSWSTLNVTYDQ